MVVRFRGWRANTPGQRSRRRAARSRGGSDYAPAGSVACLRRAIVGKDVRRWVPRRSGHTQLPARRGRGSAPPFDVCATTHRSPERDRRLQEWFGPSGFTLAPKLVDDRRGGTELARLRRRPRSRERLVQGLPFVLRQVVPLIVDDQVKLGALWQPCRLVEVQSPVLDTRTQRSHATTVRRREANRQAGSRTIRNCAGSARRVATRSALSDRTRACLRAA